MSQHSTPFNARAFVGCCGWDHGLCVQWLERHRRGERRGTREARLRWRLARRLEQQRCRGVPPRGPPELDSS